MKWPANTPMRPARETSVLQTHRPWRPVRHNPHRITVTSICRPWRGLENLDKFLKTPENRRNRGKCEDQNMLTSMIYS